MRRNTIEAAAGTVDRISNEPNTHKTQKTTTFIFDSIFFGTFHIFASKLRGLFTFSWTEFCLLININSFWARVVFFTRFTFFSFNFWCELKCRRYHKHYASQLNWRTALVWHLAMWCMSMVLSNDARNAWLSIYHLAVGTIGFLLNSYVFLLFHSTLLYELRRICVYARACDFCLCRFYRNVLTLLKQWNSLSKCSGVIKYLVILFNKLNYRTQAFQFSNYKQFLRESIG